MLDASFSAVLFAALGTPSQRDRLVTAYSRTADALFILHDPPGGSPKIARLTTPRPGQASAGPWTVLDAPSMGEFGLAPTAIFSTSDWRIWVIDRESPSRHWRLRRIHPLSGAVESYKTLPSLASFSEVWVAGFDDGRVVIAGNRATANMHVIALLSSRPFVSPSTLSVTRKLEKPGQLIGAPHIARGVITALVHPEIGEVTSSPATVAYTEADLTKSWSALGSDLQAPDQPVE